MHDIACMKRDFDPNEYELMDKEQPASTELAVDLENLRRINQWFGSYSLLRKFLRHWLVPGRNFRILDLATGYGDIPRMIVRMARERGVTVGIDAVEQQPGTLEIARNASVDFPEIRYLRADARNFENSPTYDIVLCTLALHHFSEEDAIRLLRRVRKLSHDAILVSDLERTWLNTFLIQLMTLLVFREPMTVHDARMSIRRAFSFAELAQLAKAAGWEGFEHRHFFPGRQAIWMHVRDGAPVEEIAAPVLNPLAS